MDESSSDNESLYARIRQLEKERDELHKDIEQLCKQQAGPSYIALATQMHFRRTAGLEQEIENLKKKLAACNKENSDLQEELSEAKRIKTHLDQLHKVEVAKNTEVAKQLEYLRGAVANAFADRDNALMEAEKAKENEELMSQKVDDAENRLKELTVESAETQEQIMSLQIKLAKQEQEIETFRMAIVFVLSKSLAHLYGPDLIINKFHEIRQHACSGTEAEEIGWDNQSDNICWDDKLACLYNDPPEAWSFNVHREASTPNYIVALQEELETLRGSIYDLQNKLQMGLEIENHLKRRVRVLEQKKIVSDRLIFEGISSLREHHSQQKIHIMDLLDDGKSYLQSIVVSFEEMIAKSSKETGSAVDAEVVDISTPNISQTGDSSEVLTRALQEKQEERHQLEINVYAAVQETMNELQRNLKQATEEKVKALVELAVLKQEYQLLLERTTQETIRENHLTNSGERRIVVPGRDGKLKSLWKKTSLKRWLRTEDNLSPVANPQMYQKESLSNTRPNQSIDDARLQIENATFKDSMHSLERLTSDIRKLRISLMQAKEAPASEGTSSSTSRLLDDVIREAELVKTALSSALPLSWSGEGDMASSSDVIVEEDGNHEDSDAVKVDVVSAAGLEMVELLMLAAETMREKAA